MRAATLPAALRVSDAIGAIGASDARDARDARWSALMRAAQRGDAASYTLLLREVAPLLRAIARRRIADAAEAEDAVQDALLTLHALRHTYDPERPFRPWIGAIAERRAVDRLRRRGRTAGREAVALDDLPENLVAQPALAEQGVAARELREAIATLPASQRTALRLAKLESSTRRAAAPASPSAP